MNDVRLTGLIAPTFWPVHRAIKNHDCAEVWLKGGRGSAKSSFLAIETILELLRHPQAHAIVYRRVANTLRESVYEQLIRAIGWLKLDGYFEYRLSPLEIRYRPTGQRILFRGADDPAKSKSIALRSGYFGVIWFEELAEFRDEDAIRTIRASVIRGGQETLTFYSYNPPKSMSSWVNKAALVPVEKRLVHHSSYLDIPEKWLGDGFIREANALKAANERAYRHIYLGEATGSGGNVFDNLALRPLTDAELDCANTYCGLDFGFAVDPDAFVRFGYDARLRKLIALEDGVNEPQILEGRLPQKTDEPEKIAEHHGQGDQRHEPGDQANGPGGQMEMGKQLAHPAAAGGIERGLGTIDLTQRQNSGGDAKATVGVLKNRIQKRSFIAENCH